MFVGFCHIHFFVGLLFGTMILLVDDFNVVCFSQLFLVGLGCRLLYFVCRFVVGWF